MPSSRRYRAAAAVLATAVLVPTALIGVGSATAQSSAVTASAVQQPGPAGPPGHRGPDVALLAAKLGVTEAELTSAFDATRPAATAQAGSRGDHGARFAADIAAALGVSADRVQAILDANRPTVPPAPGTKPDRSMLVGALSGGLGIDKATVQTALDKLQAAHKANDDARGTAIATALAKQLGLDVAKVKQALSESRPAGTN